MVSPIEGDDTATCLAGLRWAFPDMPLLQRSHGSPLAQLPPLVARHDPGVDGSEDMVHVLLILSLTFASISVLATLTALYWFVKMRRSFRHEQVIPLPQFDLASSPVLTCPG